jgi:hypothetical protein
MVALASAIDQKGPQASYEQSGRAARLLMFASSGETSILADRKGSLQTG